MSGILIRDKAILLRERSGLGVEIASAIGRQGQGIVFAGTLRRLNRSLIASAGTVVFGMEDGTVSIFGLIFGVAATTTNSVAVLVAGASGAAAAAVSMMAGAYLDTETNSDETRAAQTRLQSELALDAPMIAELLSKRLPAAGLTPEQSAALRNAVSHDSDALRGVLVALQTPPEAPRDPLEQAFWMLLADFFSAAVPILPFIFLPIPQARIVAGTATITLLVALGFGRARIGGRGIRRTIAETVSMGIAAALAGVAIGVLINRVFGG